jgi:hypothetical protein
MNWWGDISGPTHEENENGFGDVASDLIDYSPWYGDINLSSLRGIPIIDNDVKSYIITKEFNVINNGFQLIIFPNTTVSGGSEWVGQIDTPTTTTVSLPVTSGYTKITSVVIEVGFINSKLILSQAAKLIFSGESGKSIGYIRPGESFTEITAICGENSQAWADDNLGAEGDCKINVDSDLVVWTKHFTSFATYTQTVIATSGGGGGGGILPVSDAYANWLAQGGVQRQPSDRLLGEEGGIQSEVLGVQQFADGALIREVGEIDVYVIKYVPSAVLGQPSKQFKRLILNPSVFNSYRLNWDDVLNVEKSVVDSFITSDLVRASGDIRVYKLTPSGDIGFKEWIKTAEIFNRLGFDWDAIYEINAIEYNLYVTGAVIE